MYKNLFPGMIGIHKQTLEQSIALAKSMGFGGVDIEIRALKALADEKGIDHCRRLLGDNGIRAGNWIMPNEWKFAPEGWQTLIAEMPTFAKLSLAVGCTRASTYFGSGSDERTYDDNMTWHADRLRPIGAILADHGIGFGMEFMGPLTVRKGKKYTFVHNLIGMMDLARLVGTGNMGLLLDAWHLYTSGDSLDMLDTITAKDVVNVHISDAPLGLTMETYKDSDRRIPLETGVIDLPGFLRKLKTLGYDGPITPEPFSARLNGIAAEDPAQACAIMAEAMERLWKAAGIDCHSS